MNKTMPLQIQPKMKKRVLFLLWIGLNVGSWGIWLFVATNPAFTFVQFSDVLSFISLFVIGCGMAVLQWLLLKQTFSIVWYEWTIFTIIGFVLGLYGLIWAALRDYYIVFSAPDTPVLEWDALLGGSLLGLILGLCQSVNWRPRFEHLIVWVVANVLGWSLGMFLPQLAAFFWQDIGAPWLSTSFPVAFAAVVTGVVLVWFSEEQRDLAKRT